MDLNRIVEALITALLSGGGAVGLLNWWKVRKSREKGLSSVEHEAVAQAASQPGAPLAPDWLTRYWQKEIRDMRAESRIDKAHIDALEEHIWRGLPPPPPTRQGEK